MRGEGCEQCEEDELQSLVVLHVQVIAEGANGPTTIAAEKILLDRKVLVIPVSVHTCISPLSLSLRLSLSPSLSSCTLLWFFSFLGHVCKCWGCDSVVL